MYEKCLMTAQQMAIPTAIIIIVVIISLEQTGSLLWRR